MHDKSLDAFQPIFVRRGARNRSGHRVGVNRDAKNRANSEPSPYTCPLQPVNQTRERTTMNTTSLQRRLMLANTALLGLSLSGLSFAQNAKTMEVWKDPSCGCCKHWIEHLEKDGLKVTVYDTGNNGARARLHLPQKFASCHTALIQGYVIEGHVPAADIRRLLKERPTALGLAVPGMKIGSPGMDGPTYNGRHDPYDVLLVLKDGDSKVFSSHS